MKVSAGEFLGILRSAGISYRIRRGRVHLRGENELVVRRLREAVASNPAFEAGVMKQIEEEERLSLPEFLHELSVNGLGYRVSFGHAELYGEDEAALERCRTILARDSGLQYELYGRALQDALDDVRYPSIEDCHCTHEGARRLYAVMCRLQDGEPYPLLFSLAGIFDRSRELLREAGFMDREGRIDRLCAEESVRVLQEEGLIRRKEGMCVPSFGTEYVLNFKALEW